MKLKNTITKFYNGTILAAGVQSELFDKVKAIFGAEDDAAAGATKAGDLIVIIINILLITAGSIAVIFLIIGGLHYVTSKGNEQAAETAKNTMRAAVWGLVVIIMAYAIIYIITSSLIEGIDVT